MFMGLLHHVRHKRVWRIVRGGPATIARHLHLNPVRKLVGPHRRFVLGKHLRLHFQVGEDGGFGRHGAAGTGRHRRSHRQFWLPRFHFIIHVAQRPSGHRRGNTRRIRLDHALEFDTGPFQF